MRLTLALAVAALLATGCAAGDASVPTESPSEREYPTGSNLPRKKNAKADTNTPMGLGVRVHSRDDLERMQSGGSGVPAAQDGVSR